MDVLVLEDCVILKDGKPEGTTANGKRRTHATDPPPHTDWLDLEPSESIDSGRVRAELRKFGLVMAGATGLLGGYFHWSGHVAAPWVTGVVGAFLLTALAIPRLLAPIERFWLALGEALGTVASRVVLTLSFYFAITPLGLTMRVIFGETLGKRPNPVLKTYWEGVEADGPASRPDKPF